MPQHVLIKVRHTLFLLVACLAALLGATGCTHGTGSYYDIQRLQIGSSNVLLCDQMFATPISQKSVSVDNKTFEWRTYNLQSKSGEWRLLNVELLNRTVNGYSYLSTAEEDRTIAKVSVVPQVKSGTATKQDVLRLLGKPSGQVKFPCGYSEFHDYATRPDLAEAWMWMEVTSPYSWNCRERGVYVIFDRNGRVFRTMSFDRPMPVQPRPQGTTYYYTPQYRYVPAPHSAPHSAPHGGGGGGHHR